ncbi:flagellar basal body-associated FliL family protein [Salipaludibacillus sp. HK11]|uniref:flagellar basal body-associated FliL family protein n=1 Tax=Salipaludibacillus sp. HK11 TaxID=3394320 RepID=UPI0039FCF71A
MAERNNDIQKNKLKNKKRKPIIIFLGGLSVLLLVITIIVIVLPNETILSAYDELTSEDELNRVYHLEENGYMLDNGEYVRISISFLLEDSSNIDKLSRGQAFLRHSITKSISGADRTDFQGNKGLEWFENEIMNDLNQSFSDIDIERVYITGMVIS